MVQFVSLQLLEYYNEYEEAKEVLREYAYNSKFPSNPNAYVYFYQFLKRRGKSRKTQIAALQVCNSVQQRGHYSESQYNVGVRMLD